MNVETQIARLETLAPSQLRERWVEVTASVVPRVSPKLLRLALAWELQAKGCGGLSRDTVRTLDQLARGKTRTTLARAGTRLVREYNDKAHVVEIGEDQLIRWDGREWRSLSEVARAITGTRWSGPAFFSLKQKQPGRAAA